MINGKRILRVFPRLTSYTPADDMVIIDEEPGLFVPEFDEVHVSCTFTWDRRRAEQLRDAWATFTSKPVLIGGPAYDSPCGDFTPGLYVRQGVTFTSRGCNNNCAFCMVPKREGKLKELPVVAGNIINDNNFLQCSRKHKDNVFEMLKAQSKICFKGGLQSSLVDDHFVDAIKGLRIAELWLACDSDGALPALRVAAGKLTRAGFTRNHIRCYVLIGDDINANENRLREVYRAGAMPFAQLYRDVDGAQKYDMDWRKFHRMWSRPAATVAHMERGTSYKDYNT